MIPDHRLDDAARAYEAASTRLVATPTGDPGLHAAFAGCRAAHDELARLLGLARRVHRCGRFTYRVEAGEMIRARYAHHSRLLGLGDEKRGPRGRYRRKDAR